MVKALGPQNKEIIHPAEGGTTTNIEVSPGHVGSERESLSPTAINRPPVERLRGEKAKEASLEKQETTVKTGPKGASQPATTDSVVQVLKHISGYQPANSLAPISGASALNAAKFKQHLQKVSSGDPKKAITWQATLLLKILRVLFRI